MIADSLTVFVLYLALYNPLQRINELLKYANAGGLPYTSNIHIVYRLCKPQ